MKTLHPTTARICTCQTQPLLAYGETCEICMGVLDLNGELDLLLPQPIYDASYFEELEAYLRQEESGQPMAA